MASLSYNVLNKRLTTWTEDNNILSDAQNGFRKKRSTIDHIFTLNALIKKYLGKRCEFYVAFFNFQKVFDLINHTVLWQILLTTVVQERMLNISKSMYRKIQAYVRQFIFYTLFLLSSRSQTRLLGEPNFVFSFN